MWDKVKIGIMWIGAALTAILGIFLLFRNTEDKAKTELLVKDAKLEGKQEVVQTQMTRIKRSWKISRRMVWKKRSRMKL